MIKAIVIIDLNFPSRAQLRENDTGSKAKPKTYFLRSPSQIYLREQDKRKIERVNLLRTPAERAKQVQIKSCVRRERVNFGNEEMLSARR